MAHPVGLSRQLVTLSLLLATIGCGRPATPPKAPASPLGTAAAGLPAPQDHSHEYVPSPPTRTTRVFGVFRVVQESRPGPEWGPDRWDRVQVFRDGQRLLQITSAALGPNVKVHPATGRDITGDGTPEIVLTSQSGGNHCCEDLVIYTATPTVSRLAHMEGASCLTELSDIDRDGVLELVTCDILPDIPAVEALQCSEAERPKPAVIYRFEATTGQYRLATPDFAPWRRDALRRAVVEAEQRLPDAPCVLYGAALDVLYGGDRQGAERLLRRLQPANCDGGGDCAEQAARLFTDLRTQLWEALRRSDQYLARSDPHAPVLSQ